MDCFFYLHVSAPAPTTHVLLCTYCSPCYHSSALRLCSHSPVPLLYLPPMFLLQFREHGLNRRRRQLANGPPRRQPWLKHRWCGVVGNPFSMAYPNETTLLQTWSNEYSK